MFAHWAHNIISLFPVFLDVVFMFPSDLSYVFCFVFVFACLVFFLCLELPAESCYTSICDSPNLLMGVLMVSSHLDQPLLLGFFPLCLVYLPLTPPPIIICAAASNSTRCYVELTSC